MTAPSEGWPPDSRECIFLGRAISRLSEDEIWNGLTTGTLIPRVYCVGCSDFGPIPVSQIALTQSDRKRIFTEFQLELRDVDKTATTGAEHRATQHLAALLTKNPDMSRPQAQLACKEFGIAERGFLNRVWGDAREIAGLPRRARAGAKLKRQLKR